MTPRIPMLVLAAAAVVAAAACSGGGGGGGRDYGAPSTTYPAPHAKLPAVIDHGGPKLTSPKLVAITYDGDPYQAQLDDFVANVGASRWWMAVTSGYGIGPVVSTTSVHIAEAAPPYILKSDMEAWLASHLNGSDPSWPQPDPQTLYLLFYPAGTTVDDPGTNGMGPSCQYWYAYHYQINGVWYAVMPECPVYGSDSELDVVTSDASHELIEAATDPDAFNPAWDGVANGFAPWGLQDEVGDLCEGEPYADYEPADLPYKVQRSWSNVAAAAGSDPCAPETYPFFGAPPKELDSIAIDFGPGSTLDTFGVQVKKGTSKTLELDYFSDQPTGTIHLTIRELLIDSGQTPAIAVTLDHPEGVNGDKAYLTLTGLGSTTLPGGLDFLTITADMGGFEHTWPLWVVTQ